MNANPQSHMPGGPQPPSPEQIYAQQFMESCPFKAVTSGVMGFGIGGLFGLFMAGVDFSATNEHLNKSTKEQIKYAFRDMGSRSWGNAKGFALVAAVFSGTECIVESYRAKNDIYNSLSAGCITGGVLAGRAGPKAALGGCATFAAFSAAIDWYMKEREE
ncbi:Tim17/Tim22/Tim23/Pmp24 family-domain-containing protein [Paraphysoderma sedebokerense]|nr:Tim17/Tim22/Tim23/Pmp24 family-domain-containing protein [Paraphysoderma sedebokerense]